MFGWGHPARGDWLRGTGHAVRMMPRPFQGFNKSSGQLQLAVDTDELFGERFYKKV